MLRGSPIAMEILRTLIAIQDGNLAADMAFFEPLSSSSKVP